MQRLVFILLGVFERCFLLLFTDKVATDTAAPEEDSLAMVPLPATATGVPEVWIAATMEEGPEEEGLVLIIVPSPTMATASMEVWIAATPAERTEEQYLVLAFMSAMATASVLAIHQVHQCTYHWLMKP